MVLVLCLDRSRILYDVLLIDEGRGLLRPILCLCSVDCEVRAEDNSDRRQGQRRSFAQSVVEMLRQRLSREMVARLGARVAERWGSDNQLASADSDAVDSSAAADDVSIVRNGSYGLSL